MKRHGVGFPNIREVRHTIWRLFHVTPVTMGETRTLPARVR